MYCVCVYVCMYVFSTTVHFPFTFLFARYFTYFYLSIPTVFIFVFSFVSFQRLLCVLHFNCYTKYIRILNEKKAAATATTTVKKKQQHNLQIAKMALVVLVAHLCMYHLFNVPCFVSIFFSAQATCSVWILYRWLIIWEIVSICMHNKSQTRAKQEKKAQLNNKEIKAHKHEYNVSFAVFR